MTAHGIMFHHFTDHSHPRGQGAIDADELRNMLLSLGPKRILSPQEWMERVAAGSLDNEDLCLTLDDGLRCQYDVALPVFEELGLRAFWFVYSSVFQGKLERLELYRYFRTVAFEEIGAFYASFSEVVQEQDEWSYARAQAAFNESEYLKNFPFYTTEDRWFRYLRDEVLGVAAYNEAMDSLIAARGFDLASAAQKLWLDDAKLVELTKLGHVVGLHSTSHPTRLERLPAEDQAQEYAKNFEHLTSVLGASPVAMSHPCNSCSAHTLEVLKKMGIRVGFCSNMAPVANRSCLELPRQDHANLMHKGK